MNAVNVVEITVHVLTVPEWSMAVLKTARSGKTVRHAMKIPHP